MLSKLQSAAARGENIVVSVGLLPLEVGGRSEEDGNGNEKRRSVVGSALGPGRIYPLDVFTLDIFVFDQSGLQGRLGVTYPGQGRKEEASDGRRIVEEDGISWVLAMDRRVWIG